MTFRQDTKRILDDCDNSPHRVAVTNLQRQDTQRILDDCDRSATLRGTEPVRRDASTSRSAGVNLDIANERHPDYILKISPGCLLFDQLRIRSLLT